MSIMVFENRNVKIIYHNSEDYLFIKWDGFIKSDEFRKAAGEIIKAIEKTNVKFVLSDNTDWKVISPNDHGWAAYNWFPEAEAKGVKKLATVLSTDYFNRAAEKSIEGMADVRCLKIANFQTVAEASAWLTENKKVQNCI
jgi:hypothetical protein